MTAALILAGIASFLTAIGALLSLSRGLAAQAKWVQSVLALMLPIVSAWMLFSAYSEARNSSGPALEQTLVSLIGVTTAVNAAGLTVGGDPASDEIVDKDLPAGLLEIQPAGNQLRFTIRNAAAARRLVVVVVDDIPRAAPPLLLVGDKDDLRRWRAYPSLSGAQEPWFTDTARAPRRAVSAASFLVRSGADVTIRAASDFDTAGGSLNPIVRFTPRLIEGAVSIDFATPELARARPGDTQLATGASLNELPPTDAAFVVFERLGSSFEGVLSRARLTIPGAITGARTFVTEGASRCAQSNTGIVLGASCGEQTKNQGSIVRIRVDPVSVDTGLRANLDVYLATLIAASVGLTWRLRCRSATAALILGLAELLMSLRILVAIEGGLVDSTAEALEALPAALIAFPLVMLVLTASMLPLRKLVWPAAGYVLQAALCATFIAISAESSALRRPEWLLFLMIPIAVGARPVLRWSSTVARAGLSWATDALLIVKSRMTGPPWNRRAAPRMDEASPDRAPTGNQPAVGILQLSMFAVVILGLLLLTRYGLATAGYREQIPILGIRFALSLVALPIIIFAIAPLLSRVSASVRPNDALLAAGSMSTCFVLIALANGVAEDNGLTIVVTTAFMIAAMAAILSRPVVPTLWSWILAAGIGAFAAGSISSLAEQEADVAPLLLGAGLIAVVSARSIKRRDGKGGQAFATSLWLAPSIAFVALLFIVNEKGQVPPEPVFTTVSAAVASERSTARLLAALAPDRFAGLASEEAFNIRNAVAHMREYADTLSGRDYLNLPPVTQLRGQQFSDYVSAIHVISPFGRWGAAGLVLALGGLALVGLGHAAARRDTSSWIGALAASVFAMTSIYMILSNALAAPLTGRNVYLLAMTSSGDLFEGAMLLMLMAATLVSRPDHV